jgi:hypothetical protein
MGINSLRLAFLILAASLDIGPCLGQTSQQSCVIPLVATRYNPATGTVQLVEGLAASDLKLTIGSKIVPVSNISADSRPKRVVLVLDASRKVPEAEWELETDMAATLVHSARPDDRFALVLTGQETTPFPFQSASEIQRQLNELYSNRPLAPDGSERNFDALKAAVSSLNSPSFGDTVFLFGHPEDDGSAATFDQIKQIILEGGTRFYGISFTDPLRDKLPAGFDPNKPGPNSFIPPQLDQLAHLTGYFVSYHSLEALAQPGQSRLFRNWLVDLYAGVAAPYRVEIPHASISTQSSLAIQVNRELYKNDIHYPQVIYPCTIPTSAGP